MKFENWREEQLSEVSKYALHFYSTVNTDATVCKHLHSNEKEERIF